MRKVMLLRACSKFDNGTVISNLFTDDLTCATPPDLEQAVVHLARSGVEEKFRLDFKENWDPEKQCPDIGALANSYGGLLVLGVSNDRTRFPGVAPPKNSDLKTQISSVIATRFAPVPVFEVHTCPAPGNTGAFLVVIRVVPQPHVHLYLKGDRPVYVRSEDKTIPATATQLQALLDRARNAELIERQTVDLLSPIARDFYVSRAQDPTARFAERQAPSNRIRSDTYCTICLAPEHTLALTLDVTLEQRFERSILQTYPSIGHRRAIDLGSSIAEHSDRGRSWYCYHYLDLDRDHEAIWALNNQGFVQYTCQIGERVDQNPPSLWSVIDLFVNINSTLRLAHEVWMGIGYFGEGHLVGKVCVANLVPACNNRHYLPLFFESPLELPLTTVRKLVGSYPVSQSSAELLVSYDRRTSKRNEALVSVSNQFLRDLRFGVDTSVLLQVLATL